MQVGKHYLLPVVAVIETMKASPDLVVLHSQVAALPGMTKNACVAQIVLGQGKVYACTITTATGSVLLQQQEAYRVLERCGDLSWSVTLATPSLSTHSRQQEIPPGRGMDGRMSSMIPSLRVNTLAPETLASFSHAYRQVLVLVDGKRSIEEIARLLARPADTVHHMLVALAHLVQF